MNSAPSLTQEWEVISIARPTPAQLKRINKFAKEPLTEENTYVHQFRLIGTRFIPSRFLQIDRSLLDIYKKDVDRGDVVQIADHTFGGWFSTGVTLPFGRFFEGEVVEDKGEAQLDGWMYMKAAQKTYVQNFTTDDISQQLDAGTLDDSSVSITWGRSECSICKNDIRDWENCKHWPGKTYKVDGKDILCFVTAMPAEKNDKSRMVENSLVCAGAYPDAGHLSQAEPKQNFVSVNTTAELKLVDIESPVLCLLSANSARFLVEPGNEPDLAKLHDLYHSMYKEGLPEGWTMRQLVQKHSEAVEGLLSYHDHYLIDALDGTLPANLKERSRKEEEGLTEPLVDQTVSEDEEVVLYHKVELQEVFGEEIPEDWDVRLLELARDGRTSVKRIEELAAEVASLTVAAEQGRELRAELVDDTIKWGIRADGNDFNEKSWRELLKSADLETIRGFKAQFEKKAKDALNTGRTTEIQTKSKPSTGEYPAEAYKC